jgi:hypothetical protein
MIITLMLNVDVGENIKLKKCTSAISKKYF